MITKLTGMEVYSFTFPACDIGSALSPCIHFKWLVYLYATYKNSNYNDVMKLAYLFDAKML